MSKRTLTRRRNPRATTFLTPLRCQEVTPSPPRLRIHSSCSRPQKAIVAMGELRLTTYLIMLGESVSQVVRYPGLPFYREIVRLVPSCLTVHPIILWKSVCQRVNYDTHVGHGPSDFLPLSCPHLQTVRMRAVGFSFPRNRIFRLRAVPLVTSYQHKEAKRHPENSPGILVQQPRSEILVRIHNLQEMLNVALGFSLLLARPAYLGLRTAPNRS